MATNPVTGVDPEVDRFSIYDTTLQAFINHNAVWPRVDGGPIFGGNPDRKYYKRVHVPPPDYDHRYTPTTVNTTVDADPTPPEGHPAGEYRISIEISLLPAADLKAQVDTAFQQHVRAQFPAVEDPSRLLLAAGALARRQDGATLTAEQTALIEAVKGNEDAISQLETRRQELYAAIDAGDDYDLTQWPTV